MRIAALSQFAREVGSNLAAGLRLALFLRVGAGEFRVTAAHYAALVVVDLAFWAGGGAVREGLPAGVDREALTVALAQVPVMLFACVLVAHVFGRTSLALAFAVMFTAADPLFEAVGVALRLGVDAGPLAGWESAASWLLIGWTFAAMLRAQWLLTGWRMRQSLASGVVFALLLGAYVFALPRGDLWIAGAEEPDEDTTGIAREDLFHLQGGLLEYRLSELEPERPGVEDIYFIGVAPYALQDTFARELGVVSDLMDKRFDTEGRSLLLVNHPATLQDQPVATATNLRAAIERVGAGINTEEDVVFLFITTHGNEDHELAFELPPLKLQQLTPTALARLLADSGIKWKIVVLSACYSGAYIEPLKDDHTLVITATDDSHPSFGCEYDSDITWFSQAYFDRALRSTLSFTEAFQQAKEAIARRERAGGLAPSNPQMFVGEAMRRKLDSIAKRLEGEGEAQPKVQAKL